MLLLGEKMTPNELTHERAMNLAEAALLARKKGQAKKYHRMLREAYDCEAAVATQAVAENLPEPSRSVLLRSAAALALQCEEERQAEHFATLGLSGEPPAEIADQLRDVLEQVRSSRHLRRGGAQSSGPVNAQKQRPGIISVHLSPQAKMALDTLCEQRATTIKSVFGRLIEWFNGLDRTEQSIVLGQVEESDVKSLAELIAGHGARSKSRSGAISKRSG